MPALPKPAALVYALLLTEALLFTYWRNILGDYASPLVLLGCSLAACLVAYGYLRHRSWPSQLRAGFSSTGVVALACAVGLAFTVPQWYKTLQETEVGIHTSDIIPALSIYTQRLLAGDKIYLPFDAEIGYPMFPTYLPATWGPYLVPQALGFDYRWMSGLLLLMGIGAYEIVLARRQLSKVSSFVLALLPFGLVYAVLRADSGIVGSSIEMMIVGYYFVLVAGILGPGRWLRILGLVLCLLSRFSLVLWVPLYLGLLWFRASKREAWLTVGGVAVGVLALYVLPFLAQDWSLLARMQQTYTHDYTMAALSEWHHLNSDGMPYHLYNGIGAAAFFYRFAPGDLLARISLLKQVQVILLLAATAGMALLYARQRGLRMNYRLFAVLTLKVYLAIFYAFVQVPYAYLMVVSIALSAWVVLLVAGAGPVEPTPASYSAARRA